MKFFKAMLAAMLGSFLTILILLCIGVLVVIGIIAASSDTTVVIPEKTILTLQFNKPIMDRTPSLPLLYQFGNPSRVVGLNDILANIKKAKEDEHIQGIYLNAESVNAGIGTIEEIRSALSGFKESGKFIIAFGNNFSQAGYYLATVADEIHMNPQGLFLFKGLNAELFFIKGALEKLDVEVQIIRHGKFKSATELFSNEKMSVENREQITRMITSIWEDLLFRIAESRDVSKESLNRIADSLLIRTPEDALAWKLIDELSYKDQVIDLLKTKIGLDSNQKISLVSLEQYTHVKGEKISYKTDKIAVVYAEGEVVDGEGDEQSIGGERIARAIRTARNDKRTKAIVLRVNSPGGSALASEIIWREVNLASQEKPVVASFGNVAASGGYYISCAATRIVADPTTITGSIGVWAAIPNLKGLMNNKLGVTFDYAQTNSNADFISVTKPLSPLQVTFLQHFVDNTYQIFTTRVADGRRLRIGYIDSIGQGRVWSGSDALKLGLVDTLGGLDIAIRTAAELAQLSEYRITNLPVQKDPLEQLLDELTGNINPDLYLEEVLGDHYTYFQTLRSIQKIKGIQTRMPLEITVY
ncbi:MAG: signal peptide peptidase SppA [Bacteroidales bacterium]|nr:signal peptide peptidase SppA [Bacteroidales bacterium]